LFWIILSAVANRLTTRECVPSTAPVPVVAVTTEELDEDAEVDRSAEALRRASAAFWSEVIWVVKLPMAFSWAWMLLCCVFMLFKLDESNVIN
jgi:hypothetical protein